MYEKHRHWVVKYTKVFTTTTPHYGKIHLPRDGVVPPSIRLEHSSTRVAPTCIYKTATKLGMLIKIIKNSTLDIINKKFNFKFPYTICNKRITSKSFISTVL